MLWKPSRESEQNSSEGRKRTGFAGVPLQAECARGPYRHSRSMYGFLYRACRENFWGKFIWHNSPTRYREVFWGNMICINFVDDGRSSSVGVRMCCKTIVIWAVDLRCPFWALRQCALSEFNCSLHQLVFSLHCLYVECLQVMGCHKPTCPCKYVPAWFYSARAPHVLCLSLALPCRSLFFLPSLYISLLCVCVCALNSFSSPILLSPLILYPMMFVHLCH